MCAGNTREGAQVSIVNPSRANNNQRAGKRGDIIGLCARNAHLDLDFKALLQHRSM